MNYKNLLKQYDKNLNAMWSELSDPVEETVGCWQDVRNLKLRLFESAAGNTSREWRINWDQAYSKKECRGDIDTWKNGGTTEVNYLADKIRTDFVINRIDNKVLNNLCQMYGKSTVLWQVIWVLAFKYDEHDRLLTYPIDCMLIYNNERLWTTKEKKGNRYRDFVADQSFDIKEFV